MRARNRSLSMGESPSRLLNSNETAHLSPSPRHPPRSIYTNSACTTHVSLASLASLNLLMGVGACVVVPGLGSGKAVGA